MSEKQAERNAQVSYCLFVRLNTLKKASWSISKRDELYCLGMFVKLNEQLFLGKPLFMRLTFQFT